MGQCTRTKRGMFPLILASHLGSTVNLRFPICQLRLLSPCLTGMF